MVKSLQRMIGLVVVAAFGLSTGVCVGQGASASGTAKRPMTFADLMAMKRVSDPQISPSGKWVMFSVTEVNLEKNTKINNLWVVPIEGGAGGGKERQLTFGDVSQTNGRFSPDGKWVSLTSAGGGSSQIWTAAWDDATGTMQKPYPLTNVSTEADGAIWSPDSQRLLFVSSVYPECSGTLEKAATWAEEEACDKAKDEAAAKSPVKAQVWDELLYRHWDHYTGEKRSHVLVVSRANGEEIRDLTPRSAVGDAETPTFSLGGPIGYAWAPDSKEIAYVTNLDKVPAASTNNDVFTLQIDVPAAKAVKISTSPGSDDAPAYSPDGKYLAFRSQARAGFESDLFRLMLYDRMTKSLRDVPLVDEGYSGPPAIVVLRPGEKPPPAVATPAPLKRDLDLWVDEYLWASDSQRIFFVAGDKGQEVIYGTNVPSGNLHRYGKIVGSSVAGEWSSLIQIGPGYRLAGLLMKVDKPAEVAIANLSEMDDTGFVNVQSPSARKTFNLRERVTPGTPNYLTHVDDALLSRLEMAPLEPFWFVGAEGTKIEGFLIKPPNFDPNKKYPMKFLMHGGPQTAWGDSWSYRWNWELMAADGYVVVGDQPARVDGVWAEVCR